MTTLTFLGLCSMAFVAWFTYRAYQDDTSHAGEQSRREAIIEVWVGIVIGFALNWLMNWLLLPLVGAKFTGWQNFMLGWCYTAVSVLRGYVIRRWAERDIKLLSAWLARQIARLQTLWDKPVS
jgi:high-affinity Fe2+/Pb2+ permease